MDQPSVGRIVHYVAGDSLLCRAAVITEVAYTGSTSGPTITTVSLGVIDPARIFFPRNVKQDDNRAAGTWHWPERV
jgi:hypothetical protein